MLLVHVIAPVSGWRRPPPGHPASAPKAILAAPDKVDSSFLLPTFVAQENFIRIWFAGVMATAVIGVKTIVTFVIETGQKAWANAARDFRNLDKIDDARMWFERMLDSLSIQVRRRAR